MPNLFIDNCLQVSLGKILEILKEKTWNKLGKFKLTVNLALAKKNGPSVETDWPLTIACHMKKF
jgi:hypothetical protein